MLKTLQSVSLITLQTNENKDKVNQTQARAIKSDLSSAMLEVSKQLPDTEIMYNSKGLPLSHLLTASYSVLISWFTS